MKYLKTKKCKICSNVGKVYFVGNRPKHRMYICDKCQSCYAEEKK